MLLNAKRHPLGIEYSTKYFFERFKAERTFFSANVQGMPSSIEREHYVSSILNSLMFLYFVQHKGFLDGDFHYLSNRLHMLQEHKGENLFLSFYRYLLHRLFHTPTDARQDDGEFVELAGHIPYLGGGLFHTSMFEAVSTSIQVVDAAFVKIFAFFDTYHWSLIEQSIRAENEINPAMLGYIFEQYINQQQMGAYYTREDITGYIAVNTIIPYLFDAVAQTCPNAFRANGRVWQLLKKQPDDYIYASVKEMAYLASETEHEYTTRTTYYAELITKIARGAIHSVDDLVTHNLDMRRFALDVIAHCKQPDVLLAFYRNIERMTVLDPTCGSGAFLFAALNVLETLYTACLERMHTMIEDNSQRSNATLDYFRVLLQQVTYCPNRTYFVRKSMLLHNLYGLDIMEEATEICKLRLFLKLLASIEHVEAIEPLPNIDSTIRVGNALVGYIVSDVSVEAAALDRRLGQSYGIVSTSIKAFERWRSSHQPFHWCNEFKEIMNTGGFDVIIGNPPYVEYDAKMFPYTLQDFATLPCSNLYPCVIERSHQLLSPQGRHGMIVPLAAFATRNMVPLIEGLQRWFPCTWLSFYHFRPAMLFSGGKVASIPTSIYLAKAQGPIRRFSTSILKWSVEDRELLFSRLAYCQITAHKDPHNRHYYPKFGRPIENTIMEKLLRHQQVSSYLSTTPNQNEMFYRSAGGLYWKVFVNFAWPYRTTSNKLCSFQDRYDRDVFVALFNSSLFWWYYTVTFDTFNVKDYMVFGFRFSYPKDRTLIQALQTQCEHLMNDFRRHARHLKRGTTGSYTVYARRSKPIIDAIDRLLAQHYGFTDEELDFIINYDSKYRMRPERGRQN